MHIAFDGTTLRPGRTGVGYYTEHLLEHAADLCVDETLTVISNTPIDTTRPLPCRVKRHISGAGLPRLVWMQTHAGRVARHLGADVVHFTNGMMPVACPVPAVVTIHDMSLTMYPGFHPARRVVLNRPFVNLAARQADAIITVSAAARADIMRIYGIDPARIHVVHEAAAPAFRVIRDGAVLQRVREQYRLADRFILYVGTIEPRKNLPALIEAFARRRASGDLVHQLVCAGPYGWLSRDIEAQIERLGIRDAVRFTGYVPFEDLPALYNLAELFVFPSVYEGFGLPVIEAMACGTPVVTGRVPALTEVAGDAAVCAASLDADALGDALVGVASNRERREDLAQLGLRRATSFSWSRAAADTLNVYRQVLAKPVRERATAPAVVQS